MKKSPNTNFKFSSFIKTRFFFFFFLKLLEEHKIIRANKSGRGSRVCEESQWITRAAHLAMLQCLFHVGLVRGLKHETIKSVPCALMYGLWLFNHRLLESSVGGEDDRIWNLYAWVPFLTLLLTIQASNVGQLFNFSNSRSSRHDSVVNESN